MELDRLSVAECVELINREDASVPGAVARASAQIVSFIEAVLLRMRAGAGGRLVYFGAGTSGRLGVLDASECPPTFRTPPGLIVGVIAGGDAALRVSSEGKEDERDGAREEIERLRIGSSDSVLGIASGGTTPYVLGALERCASRGSLTGLLTCADVPTPGFVAHHIKVLTGPEVVTGSTRMKAGTATKLVLNTITTALMVRSGKVHENLMVDVRATNEKLQDRAARMVATLCGIERGEALVLLERAGGSVKHAAVMHARGCTLAEAEERLTRAGGRLREALEVDLGGSADKNIRS